MDESRYCSELAASESMVGTAEPVDVWLLLEYRPSWRAKATADNDLTEGTLAWLASLQATIRGRSLKSRLQFIRQPESDRAGVTLIVADAAGCRTFSAAHYEELLVVDIDQDGERVDDALYFVCTNSARDRCCGKLGLPLYTALRARVGERVWQTTHLGGHRFAPNVLTLPKGCLYGRVPLAEADAFVATVEQGGLGARWLRGRSYLEPEVQAAEILLGRTDDRPRAQVASAPLGDDRWQVSFAGGASVDVTLGAPRESFASCGDSKPKIVRPYEPA